MCAEVVLGYVRLQVCTPSRRQAEVRQLQAELEKVGGLGQRMLCPMIFC